VRLFLSRPCSVWASPSLRMTGEGVGRRDGHVRGAGRVGGNLRVRGGACEVGCAGALFRRRRLACAPSSAIPAWGGRIGKGSLHAVAGPKRRAWAWPRWWTDAKAALWRRTSRRFQPRSGRRGPPCGRGGRGGSGGQARPTNDVWSSQRAAWHGSEDGGKAACMCGQARAHPPGPRPLSRSLSLVGAGDRGSRRHSLRPHTLPRRSGPGPPSRPPSCTQTHLDQVQLAWGGVIWAPQRARFLRRGGRKNWRTGPHSSKLFSSGVTRPHLPPPSPVPTLHPALLGRRRRLGGFALLSRHLFVSAAHARRIGRVTGLCSLCAGSPLKTPPPRASRG